MIPALLTALLFAFSAACGQRSSVALGGLRANVIRLAVALVGLGLLAAVWDRGAFSPGLAVGLWLFVSGLVGFGLGDVGLYLAFSRLGSRLTLLVNFCTAPLFGAMGDYLLVGQGVSWGEAGAVILIVAGVGVALRGGGVPSEVGAGGGRLLAGFGWALLAGFGQGMGASLSRMAQASGRGEGLELGGIGEAFLRVGGGLLVAALVFYVVARRGGADAFGGAGKAAVNRPYLWLLGAALFGPILGVSCYQWALQLERSAIVLAVVSLSPLLVVPIVWFTEGDRPGWRAWVGSVLAVMGVVLLRSP
jgi:drug/metabolite transporter (DMT)-like permease